MIRHKLNKALSLYNFSEGEIMKIILMFLTLFAITTLHLSAQDIDAQMETIRQASPQDRVQLMNELKRQIAQMNRSDRSAAISNLRSSMKEENRMNEGAQRQQFQNSQEMFQKQQQNQKQTANQYMQSKEESRMKLNR